MCTGGRAQGERRRRNVKLVEGVRRCDRAEWWRCYALALLLLVVRARRFLSAICLEHSRTTSSFYSNNGLAYLKPVSPVLAGRDFLFPNRLTIVFSARLGPRTWQAAVFLHPRAFAFAYSMRVGSSPFIFITCS
jgi:hypothetical protein